MDLAELGARLGPFLEAAGLGNRVAVRDVEALTGGYSLVMARFTADIDGEARHFVVRADRPADEAITHTDRAEEWNLLSSLTDAGTVPMPSARCADPEGRHLGTPAIILDEVDGEQLLGHLQTIDAAEHPAYATKLAAAIGQVHLAGPDIAPASFDRPSSWDTYIDGFIQGWRSLEANHAERDPFIRWMATWLDSHRPAPAPLTLVHGEFQTSNVMVDRSGQLQVIDWEYAHVGDPRVDLGWAQQCGAFMPPDLIGLDPVGFCEQYCDVTGLGEEIVNPLTVGWFAILSGYKTLGAMLQGQAAMAAGENHILTSAYLVSAMPFTHRMWRQGIAAMDEVFGKLEAQVEALS